MLTFFDGYITNKYLRRPVIHRKQLDVKLLIHDGVLVQVGDGKHELRMSTNGAGVAQRRQVSHLVCFHVFVGEAPDGRDILR